MEGKTEGGGYGWHSEVEAAWELASPGAGHTHLGLADHSLEQMTRQPLSPTAEATQRASGRWTSSREGLGTGAVFLEPFLYPPTGKFLRRASEGADCVEMHKHREPGPRGGR